MAHKSPEELKKTLEKAKKIVPIGSKRAHYKHPELHYIIHDVVIYEEDDEPMVIYEALYEKLVGVPFARSISIFLETVKLDGKPIQRFTKVS